jgi:peptide/nickel transport system substrate-binding protein
VCDGRRLSLRFITTALAGGFRPAVLELVQRQLNEVGVEVLPEFAPSGALFNAKLANGDFDVALFSWIAGGDAASGARAIFSCGGEDNFTEYCQRLLDADLREAERTLDPDQQGRVLNRADARIAADVPVIPLYQQTQSVAARATLRNFGLSLVTQFNPLWNAEDWWLAEPR